MHPDAVPFHRFCTVCTWLVAVPTASRPKRRGTPCRRPGLTVPFRTSRLFAQRSCKRRTCGGSRTRRLRRRRRLASAARGSTAFCHTSTASSCPGAARSYPSTSSSGSLTSDAVGHVHSRCLSRSDVLRHSRLRSSTHPDRTRRRTELRPDRARPQRRWDAHCTRRQAMVAVDRALRPDPLGSASIRSGPGAHRLAKLTKWTLSRRARPRDAWGRACRACCARSIGWSSRECAAVVAGHA
jgi:hypothetical protein